MQKTYCQDASYRNPEQAVRESFCPSAMVDNTGALYTIVFDEFKLSTGPAFHIEKDIPTSNGGASLADFHEHAYWKEAGLKYGTPPNCVESGPYLGGNSRDPGWAKNGIHNLFSPTIAQEIDGVNSDYIYICYLSPPWRWMNSSGSITNTSTEGLMMVKIKKSDLSIVEIKCVAQNVQYDYTTGCGYFPFRASGLWMKLEPEWGPCKAFFDGTYVHYFQIANKSMSDGTLVSRFEVELRYKRIRVSDFTVESYGTVPDMFNSVSEIKLCNLWPRFQKVDDRVYFCASEGGQFFLGRYYNGTCKMHMRNAYQDHYYLDTRFCSDFCIIKNGSKHIACFLGGKAVWGSGDLSATRGWDSDANYISWPSRNTACVLYSIPFPSGQNTPTYLAYYTDLNTYPSNVIYNTSIRVNTTDEIASGNPNGGDLGRLGLNTQNIVAYTSSLGHTYIIYAYCYPGKAKQLYLGYAPYWIDADDHVHLGPKCEFRDSNNTSFDLELRYCSRIISMDLKNGHLWITFMNSESSEYYYFHILAKNLVGE